MTKGIEYPQELFGQKLSLVTKYQPEVTCIGSFGFIGTPEFRNM